MGRAWAALKPAACGRGGGCRRAARVRLVGSDAFRTVSVSAVRATRLGTTGRATRGSLGRSSTAAASFLVVRRHLHRHFHPCRRVAGILLAAALLLKTSQLAAALRLLAIRLVQSHTAIQMMASWEEHARNFLLEEEEDDELFFIVYSSPCCYALSPRRGNT